MDGIEVFGEGVVIGLGIIDGWQVFVFSQDFIVFGGLFGKMNVSKVIKIMDFVVKMGCLVIGLNDLVGVCIQEGVDSFSGYGEIFYCNVVYLGSVLQISVIFGFCVGGVVYLLVIIDFILMSWGSSYMFIIGFEVIKLVICEEVIFDQFGGVDVYICKLGVVYFVYEGDEVVIDGIKDLFGYLL